MASRCRPENLPGKAVGQDAALEEGIEVVFDELRQVGASLGLSLLDEGRRVLLHQAVQRGLFRAVALVVDRGAIRRPLGLPANGLHARLPKWRARTVSSRVVRLNRPEYCLPKCAPRRGGGGVSDAGPLISLARLDLLTVLASLFAEVQVPEGLVVECMARPGNTDTAANSMHCRSSGSCPAAPRRRRHRGCRQVRPPPSRPQRPVPRRAAFDAVLYPEVTEPIARAGARRRGALAR